MFKKVFLLLIIIFLSNNIIFASGQTPVEKAEGIINKQLEIDNFQVGIGLEITAFKGQNSKFSFTYYYQKPDKIHLETQDFVLLPREAIKTLQPDFFKLDKYEWGYIEKRDDFHLLELNPVDIRENYRLILWIDPDNSQIKHAEIFFRIEGYQDEFAVQIDYEQIEGYSLPVYVEGRLAVPTKFSMGGEIKEFQEGSFTLKLSNYKINAGLPPAVRRKMSQFQ